MSDVKRSCSCTSPTGGTSSTGMGLPGTKAVDSYSDRLTILKFFNMDVPWSKMVKSAAKNTAADCCERRPKVKAKDTAPYVKLFKALGDETRLQILGLLAGAGAELCVCDIEANFELSQPTVSHHIRLLREAGIIVGERRGNWIYYTIDRSVLGLLPQFKGLLGG